MTQPAHVAQITCLALNDSRSYLLPAQVQCGGPDPVLINLQRSFAAHFKENYISSICSEAHAVPVSFPFFLSLFPFFILFFFFSFLNCILNYSKTKESLGSSRNKPAVCWTMLHESSVCLEFLNANRETSKSRDYQGFGYIYSWVPSVPTVLVMGTLHGPWYFFTLCTTICKELALGRCVQPLVRYLSKQQCLQWSLQRALPGPREGNHVPSLFLLCMAFEKEQPCMEEGWDGATIGDLVFWFCPGCLVK